LVGNPFRERLQKLGWTESRNIRIDTRWAAADVELMQRLAREIVELRPDLVLTQNTPTTAAMLQQTRSIPAHSDNRDQSFRRIATTCYD
jgi:putative ABC transport system substrate-binding protein